MDEIKNQILKPKDIFFEPIKTTSINSIAATITQQQLNQTGEKTLTSQYQKSVSVENSSRTTFKKSHTCGSLFVKCDCKPPSPNVVNKNKRRNFFQSYSHPDTPHIFTDENRTLSSNDLLRNRDINFISTKNGQVEITNSKRSSNPNFGNYAIYDVAIHPEIKCQVTKTSKQKKQSLTESSTTTKPTLDHSLSSSNEVLLRPHNIEHLANRRTVSETVTYKNSNESVADEDDDDYLEFKSNNNFTGNGVNNIDEIDAKIATNNLEFLKYNAISYQNENNNGTAAAKFLKESGILGPMMGNLIRKSSKIQDSTNTIELVRRTSKALTNKQIDAQRDLEDKIRFYQEEIAGLREIIKNRDGEISNMKREIDKLKSVLHKTVGKPAVISSGELLSSLQTNYCMSGQGKKSTINQNNIKQQNQTNNLINNNNNLNVIEEHNNYKNSINNNNNNNHEENVQQNGKKISKLHLHPPAHKKQGVSAESCDVTGQTSSDIFIPKFDKDFRSKQLIKEAITDNDFLKNIDSLQVRELVESMYSCEIAKGEYVIREGEAGAHLYVSVEGEFEVIKNGRVLGVMGPGKAFGELAILYNCTRTASIRVLEDSKVWVLDRRVFQQIMMRTGMQRIEENVNFLRSVPLLKDLSNDDLSKIADVLEVEFYPAGAYIIRQGASGDTFYLISQGDVKVTQKLPERLVENEIRTLGRGDYFGEQALIKEDKRTANIIAMAPGVECLTLDRASFTQLIGDLSELQEKDYGDNERVFAFKRSDYIIPTLDKKINEEYLDIKLKDLVTVATLGLGGFGRVELVKHLKGGEAKAYALKCLKKQHIVETRQEDHVFSERTIMLSCDSPFICRLYRTFRDEKYVYMLLDACMGGEVWTILRDRGNFDDYTAQFIIGSVLQAFDYLHARGIVYRDLKPENLLLDSKGYIKLVDFGFAKYIGYSSKTWTFCGTPEYVAPEIILNKGHDRAVDYWALGVLIHELLTGTPPFTASDPMKTYNIILKGIDMVDFPKYMSRSAITLIKRLCRDVPIERLGYQKGGIQDIKKSKWFQGFDWDGLANLTLTPPIDHPVRHTLDTTYFDIFPNDDEIPPDETSGWDVDF